MTPQERQLVAELFDRLARLESTPRDPDAERAIAAGLARAPHALYPLVQTVLVQEEALKRADARIRELSGEDEAPRESGGFLDSMRNVLSGAPQRGSVPSVRSGANESRWNTGAALASAPPQQQQTAPGSPGGGSFLGTAAATAAGVVGGALLYSSISSMFGNTGSANASPFAGDSASGQPWGDNASGGDLSRDAGLNDIGHDSHSAGLFDDAGDFGGGDFGGGD